MVRHLVLLTLLTVSTLPMKLWAADTPEALVRGLFERDTSLVSGEVLLRVSRTSQKPLSETAALQDREMADSVDLHVRWHSPYIFRIDVKRDDTVLRTIVSDGEFIDTGLGNLWSVHYLMHMPFEVVEKPLVLDLDKELWPYYVFRNHLFPVSDGYAQGVSVEYARENRWQYSTVTDASYPGTLVEFKAVYPGNDEPFRVYVIDQERMLVKEVHRFVGDYDKHHSYDEPFQTASGVWLMRTARYAIHGLDNDLGWESRIVDESVTPVVVAEDAFKIPDRTARPINRILPRKPEPGSELASNTPQVDGVLQTVFLISMVGMLLLVVGVVLPRQKS